MTLEEAKALQNKYEIYLAKEVKYTLNDEYYLVSKIEIEPIPINPTKFQLNITFNRSYKKIIKSNSYFTSCNQTFFDANFIYEQSSHTY